MRGISHDPDLVPPSAAVERRVLRLVVADQVPALSRIPERALTLLRILDPRRLDDGAVGLDRLDRDLQDVRAWPEPGRGVAAAEELLAVIVDPQPVEVTDDRAVNVGRHHAPPCVWAGAGMRRLSNHASISASGQARACAPSRMPGGKPARSTSRRRVGQLLTMPRSLRSLNLTSRPPSVLSLGDTSHLRHDQLSWPDVRRC